MIDEGTPLRVGLIGTGYIGTVVGEQFHHHPESTVRAITEIDADSGAHVPYIDHEAQTNKAEAFITAIHEGSDSPATARDALRVTAVTEAAYESARTNAGVDVALD